MLQPAVKGYKPREGEFGVEFLVRGNRQDLVILLDPVKPRTN